jgi:outer membrane receptor for ferrienterochelin and colicins
LPDMLDLLNVLGLPKIKMRSLSMLSKVLPSAFLAVTLLSASSLLLAQQAVEGDSTVVYPADYFTQWAPVTAQDMINRIPGIGSPTGGNFGSSSSGRGLGGGGGNQILINGKRVAGKDNEANSQLQRIAATKVRHIELIRGTSAEHDVRGDQILNVVLTEELSSQTYSYEINADRYMDGHFQPGGKVAVNGKQGNLNYLLSAEAEPRHDYRVAREYSVLGNFSPNDQIGEQRTRDQTTYTYAANLAYAITERSSARLNMLYSDYDNTVDVNRSISDLRVNPARTRIERERTPGENNNWEVAGDYEVRLSNDHRFKILFITNERKQVSERERFQVSGDGSERKDLFVRSDTTNQEKIVRSSYSLRLLDGQDVEFGIERAQTTLDSALRLGVAGTATPSAQHGGLVPVRVNNAISKVEEIRYEPFVVHNWQINSRMTLESSVIYEASEITQTGDVFNQRDFGFVKPKLDWRFEVRPGMQLRATATKSVRQLSFSDFVASSDNRDDDASTMAGNSDLRQEQVWNFNVGGEYRLPNDMGVIDGNVFYMEHYDVIERIDITPRGGALQSANGNIGDGNMWGMELNASIRMHIINMPNLLVTSRFNVKDSEITDPFLGVTRRFENYDRGRFQLGFRHDVPSLRMNYGINWNNRLDGNIKRYDIDNIESTYGEPNVTAFLEFVTNNNVRVRFDARNATNNEQCRIRTRYEGRISSGVVREIEDFCFTAARVVSVKINGTF